MDFDHMHVTAEQYNTLFQWQKDGRLPVEDAEQRTQLAAFIVGTYYDGLFTFNEVQHELDCLFGKEQTSK